MTYVLAINGDAYCLLGQDGGVMVADEDGELDPNGAVRSPAGYPGRDGTRDRRLPPHPLERMGYRLPPLLHRPEGLR